MVLARVLAQPKVLLFRPRHPVVCRVMLPVAPRSGFWLTTGTLEEGNQRFYKRAGYRLVPGEPTYPGAVDLSKRRR